MTNLDSVLKSRDITLPTDICIVKATVFPVVMYGCESWTIKKKWCFWTVGLEKTLESPLDCKEIKPVNSKGNQSWIFLGKTDAETPILWPRDEKSWLIRKDPDAGNGWRQEEKGMTEDEMAGWHHWLNGHEFEQALGEGEGQGGLVCCSPWHHKESDTTEWLNWTEILPLIYVVRMFSNLCMSICLVISKSSVLIVHAKLLQLCQTLWNGWTVAYQEPVSMGFPGKKIRVRGHSLLQGIFLI